MAFEIIFIVSFYLQARLFDEPQLASLCLDTIDKSTGDAINAEGFTDIDLGMLSVIFLKFLLLTFYLYIFFNGVYKNSALCVCI